MSFPTTRLFLGAGLLWLGACTSPNLGSPCPVKTADDIAKCFGQVSDDVVDDKLQKDVDILFLIDNSPSMTPKQKALASNIPKFIQKIDATGANYHVGVATSDVGTYTAPGAPWSISLGSCNTFEGDDGTLQRLACTTRTGTTSEARDACTSLCTDPSFVPANGQGFISKVNGVINVPSKMQGGQEIGPQLAFQCMALVGDAGCGVEGQLEGAKRALDGHNPNNQDFLRPSSVLAVIFITDEDDCSVSMSGRRENDPVTVDCPQPNANADYNCFNPDYRCVARDIQCDEPTNTTGEKHNCKERDSSYIEPVGTYVRFFQTLRPPSKLLISGIWTPPIDGNLKINHAPDATGHFKVFQKGGTSKTDGLNRAEQTDAACYYTNMPEVFGRPQLRLSKFATQFKDALQVSVCDIDAYPTALDNIASAIKTKLETKCTSVVPKLDQKMHPLCLVGDVDDTSPNNTPDKPFAVCSSGCCDAWANTATPTSEDAGIKAACGGEAATPCYCALKSKQADVCKNGAVAGVWRGGTKAPDRKVVNFKCVAETTPPKP